MKSLLTFVLVLFFACDAFADAGGASLFFTRVEMKRIEEALRQPEETSKTTPRAVSLDSLIYYGPKRWTLWIGGEKWTPETRKSGIEILSVSPESARLKIALGDGKKTKIVSLRPHQSFTPPENGQGGGF